MTIRTLRLQKGWSEEHLAALVSEECGTPYTPRAVAMWEHRGVQKIKILQALAAVFGLSLEEACIAAAPTDRALPALPRGRRKSVKRTTSA